MSCEIINNINQSLFVFFISGRNGCKCSLICSVPPTVNKFLIIFKFIEFLIKKFLQGCNAKTGFTLMHHVFITLRAANDLLDQAFS